MIEFQGLIVGTPIGITWITIMSACVTITAWDVREYVIGSLKDGCRFKKLNYLHVWSFIKFLVHVFFTFF